jgi:MFS family permease
MIAQADPVYLRVVSFALMIFFVTLSDAIIAFWIPNYIQSTYKSALVMGLIISCNSLVGIMADVMLPQLIQHSTVRKLLFSGIILSVLVSFILTAASYTGNILFVLVGVGMWGLYYEFLSFARKQFVADSVPHKLHSGAWGVLNVFVCLAYFLGPVIGGYLFGLGNSLVLTVTAGFSVISFLVLTFTHHLHNRPVSLNLQHTGILIELSRLRVLFVHVWPLVLMSLVLGCIDALFWTVGSVYTIRLAAQAEIGRLFLPFYILPSLFVGLVISRFGIFRGKKRIAQSFLLISGLLLSGIALSDNIYYILLSVILASAMIAVVYPMTDAVYSDIIERLGKNGEHLIGLSNSTLNISYIFSPVIFGIMVIRFGEQNTFGLVGCLTALIAGILLLTTPRKLKLPQTEISRWNA